MIRACRIVKVAHAAAAFSGEGARLHGGRWNNPGTRIIYAAESAALAMLEVLVHLESEELLKRYALVEATFEESLVRSVDVKELPKRWRAWPPPARLRLIGDEWAVSLASALLRVPSAVVSSESNYLINPEHPGLGKIRIGAPSPARFDHRLVKRER